MSDETNPTTRAESQLRQVLPQTIMNHKEYAAWVPVTIAPHGGKYLVRDGESKDIEGKMPQDRQVALELPTRKAPGGWYNSPEYQKILKIRRANSEGIMTIVEG